MPVTLGLRRRLARLPVLGIERGVPAGWLGYRWLARETVRDYAARRGLGPGERLETVHAASTAVNALPRNIPFRGSLPDDRGWWGYAFRDVPRRPTGETVIATLRDCTILPHTDPQTGEFWVAILNRDGRLVDTREIHFRPGHAAMLRRAEPPVRLATATWVLERVWHNHSHWLTAHLPKLRLLQQRQALDGVLLPETLPPAMADSLRLMGLDPAAFPTFAPDRPMRVERLTLLVTDRFRPELLRPVRDAIGRLAPHPWRRVFISRQGATRRRLVNEDALWPRLAARGFERVRMEDLSFPEQVALMGETSVLVAPHGAGLTNMIACPEGTRIVEMADLTFPNPNFYALAAAMGHAYWVVPARGLGDVHPLEMDMEADIPAVEAVLDAMEAAAA